MFTNPLRNLARSCRIAAETDRAIFEGRALFRNSEEENNKKRQLYGESCRVRKGNDGLPESHPKLFRRSRC